MSNTESNVPVQQTCKTINGTPINISREEAIALTQHQRNTAPFRASQILPKLYLGGFDDMGNYGNRSLLEVLQQTGIGRVISVVKGAPVPEDIAAVLSTMYVPLLDHHDEKIADHFDACTAFIRDGILNGVGVFVYCQMGFSRSASIVIAYLMKYGIEPIPDSNNPVSYEIAADFVRKNRPSICPNFGFCIALRELSNELGFPMNEW